MRLEFNNIGKISSATIELNGITVIAGENNTGKSTVGKLLFCIFNTLYKFEQQLLQERAESIARIIDFRTIGLDKRLALGVANEILENSETCRNDTNHLKNLIVDKKRVLNSDIISEDTLNAIVDKINKILELPDYEILKEALTKTLNNEFSHQVNNIYNRTDSAEFTLKIKDNKIKGQIKNDKVINIDNAISLDTEAVYLDDPLILDNLLYKVPFFDSPESRKRTHANHLKLILSNTSKKETLIDEIITKKKIATIIDKMSKVSSGEMVSESSRFVYKTETYEPLLDIKNISTGLKTFVILKTLLIGGYIEDNGTIILDEPEIHLHPEWQLILAEIIVLLQKEFGLHILLNTHSPYFLNAIEVYSAKHKIADKCKYYLAKNIDSHNATIDDVSDNTEVIYKKLANPLQELENLRYEND